MDSDRSSRLFVYGSLMFPEIWNMVVGAAPKRKVPAIAFGYSAYQVLGQTYPGLVQAIGNAATEGVLVFDMGETDWERLDPFEGEFYERMGIEVREVDGENGETHRAQTYLVRDGFQDQLSDVLWNVEEFAKTELPTFVDRFVS